MNRLLIREKQNDLLFSGKAEFDSFELSEMLNALAANERLQERISDASGDIISNCENISDNIKDVKTELKNLSTLQAQIGNIIKLAEVNNLPAHFVEVFTDELTDVSEYLDAISEITEKVESIESDFESIEETAGGLNDISGVGFYE